MSASVQAATAISRAWVGLYTARLPETLRNSRRAEMEADLWEHQHDHLANRTAAGITATEIVLRTCFGVFDDLAWRFEVLRVVRGSSNAGKIATLRLTSRHTQWMGLAGLTGGLLWAIYLFALMQRSRADGMPTWGLVVPVVVAALLLTGLVGFRASYRGQLGRKGAIGVSLLITSMASFFLANTVLGALPVGTGRNMFGAVLAIGFVILPIPAFILLGLALKGSARIGAFLVAVVGPLGMGLPFLLAKFGLENPQWLRGDSPVNLTFGIYFILAAAWLAAAGYSTYRQRVWTLVVFAGLLGDGALVAQSDPVVAEATRARTVSFTATEGTGLSFDLSPDGRWVILDLLGQLWRIPAEGGEAVPLTDAVADVAEDLDPVFSPDGRWIAFQGDRNGLEGLWLMPAGGGTPRLLTGTEASARARWKTLYRPAWSRDSRQLVFLRENGLFLYRMDEDRTAPVVLRESPAGVPVCLDWLPDGQLIALIRPRGGGTGLFWVFDPATGLGTAGPTADSGISLGFLITPCPSISRDGSRIAYFVEGEAGAAQLAVQAIAGGEAKRVTNQPGLLASRVRWTPDGRDLVYVADGQIRRVAREGGAPREIPFAATVAFQRDEYVLPPVRFPQSGAELPARGHMGLAISPEGNRIALLALGRLWVWPVGAAPQAVTDVPVTAGWPSWSPDGREVAWSAEEAGAENIQVTNVGNGRTRQLTAFDGIAARPSWSPDGRHIAFFFRPAAGAGRPARFAVVSAAAGAVRDTADLLLPAPASFPLEAPALVQEQPAWSPASDALLHYQPGCAKYSCVYGGLPRDELRIVPLEGDSIALAPMSHAATFVRWAADSSLVYVQGNQLWRAPFRNRAGGEPVRLTEDPALYPSVARDGTVLYIAPDGYRVLRPDGRVTSLGWPLSYRLPRAPPLLIRGAKVIDGTGTAPRGLSDVLVEDGRIARIAETGTIRPAAGVEVVAAEGRTLMPGLMDLHVHFPDPVALLALLYHGVTTVRDMGSPTAFRAAQAEAIAGGQLPGPRIVLGGARINPGAPSPFTGADIQGTRDRAEGQRALELVRALGASYVKMQFPARWAGGADLVRQAHALGLRIGGHCAHPLPLVAAGIAQTEHLTGCGPRSQAPPRADLIGLFREAGVTVVPTFAVFSGRIASADTAMLRAPDVAPFIPASRRPMPVADVWYALRRSHREAVGALHAAGVQIATGTDFLAVPGMLHLELEDLVASGLTPLKAIAAATGVSARVLGAEGEIGTVAVGAHADLILLDGDPLVDIRNTRRIWKVIQGGRVVDREALAQRAREQTRPLP
ncbi:MAG: amidohydrolase family protein [Gemmatimonadaceae bacterium]